MSACRLVPNHRYGTGIRRLLGNRLTVDQRTLTPLVLVRIQVPQPTTLMRKPHSLGSQK
jgi:hypothetical protein